ncbi:MAG: hypothetical protein IJD10_06345, partial [Clostridia bacterium]|nr:hypothetical protein [Clostridia bacterium]
EKTKVIGFDTLQDYRRELTKAYVVKTYKDTRIPHHKLLIGTYVTNETGTNIHTDAHFQDMVDCYIDFTWQGGAPELHEKYGLGMFCWSGEIGIPADPNMSEEDFRAATAGKQFDFPNLWLVYQKDEPHTADEMAAYWRTGKILSKELLPHCGYNMNLLPNYGMQLSLFDEYVDALVNTVESDFISYDHYMYDPVYSYNITDEELDRGESANALSVSLDNLDIVSDRCRKHNRDFYIILQVNNAAHSAIISIENMKYQAYSAMAFGAKSISWACWIRGWGENNILDDNGNKTEQYAKLQETNRDLKALEPVYMRYTGASNAVVHGKKCPTKKTLQYYHGNTDVKQLTQTSLTDITPGDTSAMIIGHFEKNVGEGEAFMFVGCNNYRFLKEQTSTVTFKTADPDAVVTAYLKGEATVLTPDTNGVYTVEVVKADAVFVTVE